MKIWRKTGEQAAPSWEGVNIELQGTRNPLSSILIFSVIKARGVLKADYYVEEDLIHHCEQQLAWANSMGWAFSDLLFEHFQFWKSTRTTAPHYLWAFGKILKGHNQSAVTTWFDVIIWPHGTGKQTTLDQWNWCIWWHTPRCSLVTMMIWTTAMLELCKLDMFVYKDGQCSIPSRKICKIIFMNFIELFCTFYQVFQLFSNFY